MDRCPAPLPSSSKPECPLFRDRVHVCDHGVFQLHDHDGRARAFPCRNQDYHSKNVLLPYGHGDRARRHDDDDDDDGRDRDAFVRKEE